MEESEAGIEDFGVPFYKKVRGKRGNEMELITRAPKGTVDLVPGVSEKWKLVRCV